MTTNSKELERWIGRTLVDNDGDKVGTIEDIYMDEDTGQPEWFAISTGFFGNKISFVPITRSNARGDDICSPWTKAQVKDAPHAEPDGHLTQEEEARLYRHYGLEYSESRSSSGLPAGGAPSAAPKGKRLGRRRQGHDPLRGGAARGQDDRRGRAGTSAQVGRDRPGHQDRPGHP